MAFIITFIFSVVALLTDKWQLFVAGMVLAIAVQHIKDEFIMSHIDMPDYGGKDEE